VEAYGETWTEQDILVSNGPFLLDSYLPGESITLARNPAYHGRFPGNLEMVEVILNLTDFEGLERYESNGMDVVDLSPDTIHARHRHVEEYASEPFLNTRYVKFDTQRTPFDDSRVRQAFVLAVDRERLVGEVSLMDPATGGLVPPGMPGHSPGIALPYNPDRAHQLLAQAGYPDGQGFPNLRLEVLPGPNYRARYMAAQWLDNLNIEVALEVNDPSGGLLGKKPSCNFIFQGGTADYPDPYDFLGDFTVWHNGTYERLLDRSRRTTNQGKRIQLCQAADKILIEEAVIMPVNYGRTHRLVKPWAKIPEGRLGYWSLKDVVIEPH
jgi:oligopeptide transport system substrate-binding protein